MPNQIPQKTRQEVYERATPIYSTQPACELTGQINGLEIHHITGRHSHRPENLILLTKALHAETEQDMSETSLRRQLQIGLQELYLKYYDENTARELLGGKLREGKVLDSRIKVHFKKIERRYFNV